MRVRGATPADAEAIRTVHYESIRGLGMQAYSRAQVDAWADGCESADYTAAIDADELAYVVAEVDGSVEGFGSLAFEVPDGYEADADAEKRPSTSTRRSLDEASEPASTRNSNDERERERFGRWDSPRRATRSRSTNPAATSESRNGRTSFRATNRLE